MKHLLYKCDGYQKHYKIEKFINQNNQSTNFEFDTQINRTEVIKSMSNVLNNVATTVFQNNIAVFKNTMAAVNEINLFNVGDNPTEHKLKEAEDKVDTDLQRVNDGIKLSQEELVTLTNRETAAKKAKDNTERYKVMDLISKEKEKLAGFEEEILLVYKFRELISKAREKKELSLITSEECAKLLKVNKLHQCQFPTNVINIGNVNMVSEANSTFQKTQVKNNVNIITNDISTKISTNINGAIKTLVSNNKETFLGRTIVKIKENLETTDQGAQDAAEAIINDTIKKSIGIDSIDVNILAKDDSKTNINNNIKKSLKIDDSYNVESNTNTENSIDTIINQANVSTCSNKVIARNAINLNNINYEEININNIEMKSMSNAVVDCLFDQTNISTVTNKVVNNIQKTISYMSAHTIDNSNILNLGNAIGEVINEMGQHQDGNVNGPQNFVTPNYSPEAMEERLRQTLRPMMTREQPLQIQEQEQEQEQKQKQKQKQKSDQEAESSNNMIYIGIIGSVIVLIVVVLIIKLKSKTSL
jgi:hypothetical protein